jgi:anti-sigma regulatory factor (Ser/Thr protein kinase)
MAACIAELPRLSLWLESVLAALALDDRQAYALQLVAEEMVANVMLHGRAPAGEATGDPTVELTLEPAPLRLIIEDDGAAFDPTSVAEAAPSPDLETAAIGGRGLMLVRRFSRGWRYSRTAGRNRVEILL